MTGNRLVAIMLAMAQTPGTALTNPTAQSRALGLPPLGTGRVARVLVLVNVSAGTGHSERLAPSFGSTLRDVLGRGSTVEVDTVADHSQVRARARHFLDLSDEPAAIVAGGGAGTLRAVVEAVCAESHSAELPGPDRVRLAALRLGSGNVVARQLGVELDPVAAITGIGASLRTGVSVPCCVMRCVAGRRDGGSTTHYALTLCGLGQLGRCAGDLSRWRRRLDGPRAAGARLVGIERLTQTEYGLAALRRGVASVARPSLCEQVRLSIGGRSRDMRLLAGAALNFPIRWLPEPGVSIGDRAITLFLLPHRPRLGRWAVRELVGPRDRVEIELLDRDSAEFFLDENPERFWSRLTLEVAGSLAFIPSTGRTVPFATRVSP